MCSGNTLSFFDEEEISKGIFRFFTFSWLGEGCVAVGRRYDKRLPFAGVFLSPLPLFWFFFFVGFPFDFRFVVCVTDPETNPFRVSRPERAIAQKVRVRTKSRETRGTTWLLFYVLTSNGSLFPKTKITNCQILIQGCSINVVLMVQN